MLGKLGDKGTAKLSCVDHRAAADCSGHLGGIGTGMHIDVCTSGHSAQRSLQRGEGRRVEMADGGGLEREDADRVGCGAGCESLPAFMWV